MSTTLGGLWDATACACSSRSSERGASLRRRKRSGSVNQARASTFACSRPPRARGSSSAGVKVQVEIASSNEVLSRLLAGRLQLGIVGIEEGDSRISLEPFLDDEVVGIAKPGHLPLKRGRLDPAVIAEQMLLSREPGSGTQQLADRELEAIGIRPAGVWELGSSEALKRAAREGFGIALVSRYAVAEEVERGDLEGFRLARRPPLTRRFPVARLAGRPPSPAEFAFVATLTRCCAKSASYAEACAGSPG